jgi:hypothetical protein
VPDKRDFSNGERRSDARAVCAAFFSSRLLILAVIVLTSQATVVKRTFDGRVTETTIELRQPLPALFDHVFVTGDAEWFRSIAVEGYAAGPFEAVRHGTGLSFRAGPCCCEPDTSWHR